MTSMPLGRVLREELEVATSLARRAGDAAMHHYGTATPTAKADASPVTAADHAANDLIVQGLRRHFPEDAILSEESTDSGSRLSATRVWIVDPLDGTKEFLAGNGEFAIMIGLAIDGRAELGVVYLPAADVLYGAAKGEGAWVEEVAGERRPLHRSTASPGSIRLVISRSHPDPLVDVLRRKLHIDDVLRSGSVGVKCAHIAADRRDLYLHPVSYLKEWDTCAPDAILREAGGTVTDCVGEPLRYNKPDPRHPHGILACAPGIAGQVLDTWLAMYPPGR
jgi:3'(2'), 5'-bisphosphate nucleotidase